MNYYFHEASSRTAEDFIDEVEFAVAALAGAPTRWHVGTSARRHVVEEPEIRRYVFRKFPFVISYRWEPQYESVTVYAVMH